MIMRNNPILVIIIGKLVTSSMTHYLQNALRYAIRMGYRHIDCAMIYQNEHEVGEVFGEMMDKEVPRSEFFIVGKVTLYDSIEIRDELSANSIDYVMLHIVLAMGDRSSTRAS